MRVDLLNENRINVEAINKIENLMPVNTDSEKSTKIENKAFTMNTTNVEKTSMVMSKGSSFEDIKEQAELIKNNLEVMKDKMETGQVVKMDDEGIDINNTEVDEIVTVVERIQIKLAMYCDDFSIEGTGIDKDEIKATMGAAMSTYKAAATMNDSAKAYLVKNELEPTIDNVYKAIHSGSKDNTKTALTENEWKEIKPQAEKIISEAGLEINENNLNRSRYMIENEIALTSKNIEYFAQLDELEIPSEEEMIDRIAATLLEGRKEGQTKVTGESLPFEEAYMAISVLNEATMENIMALSKEPVKTLDVLSDIEVNDKKITPDLTDVNYIKTYRQLQETRLMMTLDAGRFLENNGISINTTELSDLVDKLKEFEANTLSASVATTIEEVEKVNDVLLAIEEMKTAPAVVLGTFEANSVVSPSEINVHADTIRREYANAGEAYEALSTEVRSDLGDSLFKAVKASTDDILSGMGYEDNEENRRAVRILAYNHMEMTAQNVDKIKDLDLTANTMFKKMTPDKTLKLIRDGVDILSKDVRELSDYLNEVDSNSEIEKYSEFLYKLEKHNEISPEEREKYMAVYSLINKFEKDGMNAVGSLLEQGLDFTMGNLLTAYMTRKSGGVEIAADTNTGLAQVKDKVSYYKHLFASAKNEAMPELLEGMGHFSELTPEDFVRNLNESNMYEANEPAMDVLNEAINAEEDVVKMIAEYEIPATPNNIVAVKNLIKRPETNFETKKFEKIIDKLDSKDELLAEYEKITEDAKADAINALYDDDKILDINSLKRNYVGMEVVGNLAKKNNFYIPVNQDGKDIIINLKIVEDSDDNGKFQITFDNEKYGKVSIEAKVSENEINAHILSDSDDGIENINKEVTTLEEKCKGLGYDKVIVNSNKSEERPNVHALTKDGVSTEKLYSVAKIFVAHFAK